MQFELGALYRHLTFQTLPGSVQSTIVNPFKDTVNLNPLQTGQKLEFKTQSHERVHL